MNAARDEAELTAAALEDAERQRQAGLPSGPSSLQPPLPMKPIRSIGAVIINPGSTIEQPNICVAIMELDKRQEAMQRSASVPEPLPLTRPQQSSQGPGSSAISIGIGRELHLPEGGAGRDAALPDMQRAASVPIPQLGSAAAAASQPPDRQPDRMAADQVQESPRPSIWRRISMRLQEQLRGDAEEGPGHEQQGRGSGVPQQVMMFI